ncbi:MAG: shikimate kinase, partial [Oscillospiraceae bacterium]
GLFLMEGTVLKNVILIGMPGSGKSTVGVLLAKTLGLNFMDTDLLLQRQEGKKLQDLLDTLGTDRFLDLEGALLAGLEAENAVIAPGGSCVCRRCAMEQLKKLGTVVYLSLTLETLEKRIWNMNSRGIALKKGETLADIFAYRTPLYRQYADFTVAADGQSLEETVEAVRRQLTGRGFLPPTAAI